MTALLIKHFVNLYPKSIDKLIMNKEQYINIFNSLILRLENEVVEFKRAENSFDFDDLGKYFSALSNEAKLCGLK